MSDMAKMDNLLPEEVVANISVVFAPYRRQWIEGIKFGKKDGSFFSKALNVLGPTDINKKALLKLIGPAVLTGFDNRWICSIGLTEKECSELEERLSAWLYDNHPEIMDAIDPSKSVLSCFDRSVVMRLLTGRLNAGPEEMKNFIFNLI